MGSLSARQGPQRQLGTAPAGSCHWRVWWMLFLCTGCAHLECVPEGVFPPTAHHAPVQEVLGLAGEPDSSFCPCLLPAPFTAGICRAHIPEVLPWGRGELRIAGLQCTHRPHGHLCGAGAQELPGSPSPLALCTWQAELWRAACNV